MSIESFFAHQITVWDFTLYIGAIIVLRIGFHLAKRGSVNELEEFRKFKKRYGKDE